MQKIVRFASHRAREKASRLITLPHPQYCLTNKSGQIAEKIKGIRGVEILKKRPAGEWFPCW